MADKENKKRKLRAVMCAKFDEKSTVNVIIHYSKNVANKHMIQRKEREQWI